MYCSSCGTAINAEARFCKNCGKATDEGRVLPLSASTHSPAARPFSYLLFSVLFGGFVIVFGLVAGLYLYLQRTSSTVPSGTVSKPSLATANLKYGVLGSAESQYFPKAVAFFPDATKLAVGEDGRDASGRNVGAVAVWNTLTGERRQLGRVDGEFDTLVLSPDGTTIASSSHDQIFRLWDVRSGEARPLATGIYVYGAAFSPDGKILAAQGFDGKTYLFDVQSGSSRVLGQVTNASSAVAFAPDGKTVATAATRSLQVWDVQSGTRREFARAGNSALTIAFSPDNNSIAVAGIDGPISIFNVLSGEVRTLEVSVGDSSIRSLKWSPKGDRIAFGMSNAVMVWDLATGKSQTIGICGHTVFSVDFAPDGFALAAGSADGKVYLWDLRSLSFSV